MKSIKLGEDVLVGRYYGSSCSLKIRSDIEWMNWFLDLPHLNSIKLGPYALFGMPYDPSCSLIMESDIDMNELIFRSS